MTQFQGRELVTVTRVPGVYGVGPIKIVIEHAGGSTAPISQSVLV